MRNPSVVDSNCGLAGRRGGRHGGELRSRRSAGPCACGVWRGAGPGCPPGRAPADPEDRAWRSGHRGLRRDQRKPIRPAFEATYAASATWAIDRRPITEATFDDRAAPPPSRMWLAARRERAYGAVRLTSSTRAKASTGVRRAGPGRTHARVIDEPVDAAVSLDDALDQSLTVGLERDLRRQPLREAVRVLAELGGHLRDEEARAHGIDPDPVAAPLRCKLAS